MDIFSLRSIVKFIAVVGVALSLFFASAIVVGLIYQEDMTNFILFDGFLFCFNLVLLFILRDYDVKLSIREGILSVNIVWILIGVAGAIVLMMYSGVSFVNGFFEGIRGPD